MSREFTGPLTKDDLEWARQRLPESQIDRLIDLHGVKGKADSEESLAKADAKAREEAEKAALEDAEAAAKAQAEAHADEAEAEVARLQALAEAAAAPAPDPGFEDLIGDTTPAFDVLTKTEAEVKSWAESASDEDKAAALAAEQAREDRDPRKGVVGLLS